MKAANLWIMKGAGNNVWSVTDARLGLRGLQRGGGDAALTTSALNKSLLLRLPLNGNMSTRHRLSGEFY
jgi:hypothetical protein